MNGSLSLIFEELRYQAPRKLFQNNRESKHILNGISGEFRAGELAAIVGPSGSGKSSLLNILSGFNHGNVSGSIKINKIQVSTKKIRKMSSYVMQDTKLHDFLTVYETVMFAANFKCRDEKQRKEKIEDVLKSLGMEKSSDTFVKYLSGGQQKRLTIAIELIDDPSILFLDEPTTGLDSYSSTRCIQLLKNLALDGKTVICTIHTPSATIFDMFDQVYALADGSCIYSGSSSSLVPFLRQLDLVCPEIYSPSDFLLEIATNDYGLQNGRLTKQIGNGSVKIYQKPTSLISIRNLTPKSDDFRYPSNSTYSLSFIKQIRNLSHRSLLISTRDKTLIILRICIHLVLGIAFGYIYANVGDDASAFLDNYRYIITSVVFQLYTSYWSLQTAIPLEYPILKRERFNRWYSTSAFFTSFVLVDFPITLICSFLYVTITYLMTNQPLELNRYAAFLVISLTLCYASQGIGLVGSALLDLKLAVLMGGMFLMPFFAFSSAVVLMKDTPSYFHWLFEINFVNNAIKGMLQAIFGLNRSKIRCDNAMYCHYSYPDKLLRDFEGHVSIERVLAVLTAYAVFSRIIAFIFVKYRLKTR